MRNSERGWRLATLLVTLLCVGCRSDMSRGDACARAEQEIRSREHLPADCAVTTHAVHHWGRWVVTARIAEHGLVPLVEPRRVVTVTDHGEIHEYLTGPAAQSGPEP